MKRPVLVTVIGVIAIIVGVLQVVMGVGLIALRDDAELLSDTDLTTSAISAIAIALLIIGVLSVGFAVGFIKGSRLARNLVGTGQLFTISSGIYTAFALDASRRESALGSVGGAVVILWFLFGTEKSKAFFAKS